jgi:UDP-glucuronate 4-epimerase
MAYWSFTDAILAERPLPAIGKGKLSRDLTFVDDIVAALVLMVETSFPEDKEGAPHRIYNAVISRAAADFGFEPKVKLEDGIARFVHWYQAWRAQNG